MDKCAVYIDAGYLASLLKAIGEPRIDFRKLSDVLCQGSDRLRTYYYTCMPHQSNPPTVDEKLRYSKTDKFIHQLKMIPRFEVRLGRLQKIGNGTTAEFTQKGVDVMLAVDLVKMSWDKQIQKAIVLTADSDFVYAVQAAKDAGVVTQLYYSEDLALNKSLFDVFDERSPFTKDMVNNCKYVAV